MVDSATGTPPDNTDQEVIADADTVVAGDAGAAISATVADDSVVPIPAGLTNGRTLATAGTAWTCTGSAFEPGAGTFGLFADQSGAILDADGRGDPITWTMAAAGQVDFTRVDGLNGRLDGVTVTADSLAIGDFVFDTQSFGPLECTRRDAAFVQ